MKKFINTKLTAIVVVFLISICFLSFKSDKAPAGARVSRVPLKTDR